MSVLLRYTANRCLCVKLRSVVCVWLIVYLHRQVVILCEQFLPHIDCWGSSALSVTDQHKTSEMPLKGMDCSPVGCNFDAPSLLVQWSQRIPATLFQRPPDVNQQSDLISNQPLDHNYFLIIALFSTSKLLFVSFRPNHQIPSIIAFLYVSILCEFSYKVCLLILNNNQSCSSQNN